MLVHTRRRGVVDDGEVRWDAALVNPNPNPNIISIGSTSALQLTLIICYLIIAFDLK